MHSLCFLVLSSFPFALASLSSSSSTHILQKLLVNYDKSDPPSSPSPIQVRVELAIEDITGLSESDNSFDADLRLTQIWNDPKLSFGHLDTRRANITLNSSVLRSLWTPNVCFVNSKHTRVHLSPSPNILLLVTPDGTVRVTHRLRAEGPCEMDMSNFPMDVQRCKFQFESYSNGPDEVQLDWSAKKDEEKAIKMANEYDIPEYILVDVRAERNRQSYPIGMRDQLIVKLTFKRKLGYYMLQAYLPTHVCVAVSWVSFYLETSATPARASVGVSTLMALLLAYGNIASNLPRVSYLRALDIWMTVCTLLTFFSLLEFGVVGFIEKRKQRLADSQKGKTAADVRRDPQPAASLGTRLDSISAKAFPAAFVFFNFFYWGYYLYHYFTFKI